MWSSRTILGQMEVEFILLLRVLKFLRKPTQELSGLVMVLFYYW